MSDSAGPDLHAPREIAARMAAAGVAKARLPLLSLALLGLQAGVFIGLGALFSTLVLADAGLGFAAQRLLAGLVFSLGLLLVTVAGAELFTGNHLIAMAWASRQVSTGELLRNWVGAATANFVGAAALALLVAAAGTAALNGGELGRAVVRLATAKAQLPWGEAFARGVLCNLLVCMAVWLAMAGRSLADKLLAVVPPITAFVALGFEHSVANFFTFPLALLLGAPLTAADIAGNLVAVIAGNLVGGSLLVAGVYWLIDLRPGLQPPG